MADIPEVPPAPHGKGENFLTKQTAGLPNWAWGVVILLGVGIGYFVIKSKNAPTTSPSTTSNVVGQEQAADQAPINATAGYFPTTSVNGQTVPVVPSDYQGIYNPNGDLIGYQPQTQSTSNQTGTTSPTLSATIRHSEAGTQSQYASYDAQNSGIPLRSNAGTFSSSGAPLNNIVATIPFGSMIQLAGSSVTGTGNDTPSGNPVWYPVTYNGQQGYVSAADIGNVSAGAGAIAPPRVRQTEGIYH
jgi:hypothetical protein